MPASWAKAFSPTIALFGCTWTPVMWERRREALKISSVRTRVSTPKKSLRVRSAITISSSDALRALADPVDGALHLPGAVHDGSQRVRHRLPDVVVAVDGEDDTVESLHLLVDPRA